MPNCGGAVGGKHIESKASPNSGSHFFNYKKTYSLVLMEVCDFEYKLTLVTIGAYGSSSDGGIFEEAQLREGLFNGTLNFLEEKIRIRNAKETPCFLAAYNTFSLSVRLMKPYPGDWNFNGNDQLQSFTQRLGRQGFQMAYKMRDTAAEYFISLVGRVSWQEDYLRRGQNQDN